MQDPPPTFEQAGLDRSAMTAQRDYNAANPGLNCSRTGAGDWGEGHDIFQLPENCPDRKVHSMSELKAVYKKYGINADKHTYNKGQGPGSENTRRRGGSLRLDNHDRDLGY